MNYLAGLAAADAAVAAPGSLFASLGAAGPAAFVDSALTFQDKRNRNPNWTDHEIVRFLEMLQEDESVKDLVANRNKKVFCNIAQRMCAEGAEKSWDQCRIKLKNLKSQYRYVKERIPSIDQLDLEDDDVVRQLISECQGRGISPSSIKHLRFLLRFLNKQKQFSKGGGGGDGVMASTPPSSMVVEPSLTFSSGSPGALAEAPPATAAAGSVPIGPFVGAGKTGPSSVSSAAHHYSREGAVSPPPSSPFPGGLKIVNEASLTGKKDPLLNSSLPVDPLVNVNGIGAALAGVAGGGGGANGSSLSEQGYKFLEQFNRDMMDQFMEHQRRTQASFTRWEQERWRQERESMERWRTEAREHERQLFGMFCTAMAKCNAAITAVLKAKAAGGATNNANNAAQNSQAPSSVASSNGSASTSQQQQSAQKRVRPAAGNSESNSVDSPHHHTAAKRAREENLEYEEEIDDDEAIGGGGVVGVGGVDGVGEDGDEADADAEEAAELESEIHNMVKVDLELAEGDDDEEEEETE